jgi:hypothetical protein
MYRILTEDKNRETILSILDAHVYGYTVSPVMGAWRGQREASLAIDLVATSKATVVSIATHIKAANEQESVLILDFTAQPIYV